MVLWKYQIGNSWTLEMIGKRQNQLPAEEHVVSDWWNNNVELT